MGDYGWKDKGRRRWEGERGKEEVGEREGGEARGKKGGGGEGGKGGNGSGPGQVLEEIDVPATGSNCKPSRPQRLGNVAPQLC